jgi:hypothetical protein
MKILWTFCVYNEIELLPFKIDYIVKNNIDCYVFDNMSTDGSWEWLQKTAIPSERFDSEGMFNLRLNTRLITKKIHELKPDWAMFSGCDIFYVHRENKTLRQVIEEADRNSFSAINSGYRTLTFYYTGIEKPGIDPRLNYMFCDSRKILHEKCIAKYCPTLVVIADHFKFKAAKVMRSNNFLFLHYSMRHDGKKRKTEQYLRRKKAWDNGLVPKHWGHHYEKFIKQGKFSYNSSTLSDIRKSKLCESIKSSVEKG